MDQQDAGSTVPGLSDSVKHQSSPVSEIGCYHDQARLNPTVNILSTHLCHPALSVAAGSSSAFSRGPEQILFPGVTAPLKGILHFDSHKEAN
ncbi:MAG TPA: hypothetical protein VGS02_18030 [Acidobacteriaceae bacterium]|nr:hypothetical protein [Acidobacteriaceae bacterium]